LRLRNIVLLMPLVRSAKSVMNKDVSVRLRVLALCVKGGVSTMHR
jgi:hypothetical protein